MPNGAEWRKKYPEIAELLQKPSSLARGLRKARQEELVGPFSLLGIPKEDNFNKASIVISNLQRTSFTEPPHFTKESTKASEDVPKITKKRGRDLLNIKSIGSWA